MVRKFVFFLSFSLLLFPTVLHAKTKKLTRQGTEFLHFFVPQVAKINYEILQKRERILHIREYFTHTNILSFESRLFLIQTAREYRLDNYVIDFKDFKGSVLSSIEDLSERVDIVPLKLVLAQAIIETGWGRSKAAQQTNNYFGLTTLSSESGKTVTSDGVRNYYLKSYNSLHEGIADYIHVLNTRRSYRHFRDIRAKYRDHQLPLRAEILSQGLLKYSELGEVYIAKLNVVIQKYLPNDLRPYVRPQV